MAYVVYRVLPQLSIVYLAALWEETACLSTKTKLAAPVDGVDGISNLCVDGHIAPELILFGPARASTSTFARNLAKSPGIIYGDCLPGDPILGGIMKGKCPNIGIKEMHFYEQWDGSAAKKKHYLAHYPACQQQKRIVAADLTPGQYHVSRIATLYADKKDQIKFVMLLRDPIKCLQSFYYYEKQDRKKPFKDYAQLTMSGMKPFNGWTNRYLENVMYAPAIQRFLSSFQGHQLTVAPMQYNEGEKNGMPRLTNFLWEHFGLPPAPQNEKVIDRWNFNDKHPKLDEDLDVEMLTRLRGFLEQRTGAPVLAKLLSSMAATPENTPRLYGFSGSQTDSNAIVDWLVDGW
jgi:hypothetical protein